MIITKSNYKNVFALKLETEYYTALVLPNEGGKIASFFDKRKGKEYLLQNPSKRYLHVGLTDEFEKGECSGFDDMFPTIDPVTVGGKEYPDHGEVCRVPFSYEIVESEKKAKESSKKGKKDKGAQLTAKDFTDAGMTPPMVGAEEKPDDGSHLED